MHDFSEVVALSDDLQGAGLVLRREATGALHRTSMKIKRESRAAARKTFAPHAKFAAKSIDYDLTVEGQSLVSEVGYRDEGGPGVQGFLGAVLEYGGVHSPPHPVLGDALDDSLEDFVTGQEKAAEVALRKLLR